MRLSEEQMKSILALVEGDRVTIGGDTKSGYLSYEIQRVTSSEYKVGVYAIMVCLNIEYMKTHDEVIKFIETS